MNDVCVVYSEDSERQWVPHLTEILNKNKLTLQKFTDRQLISSLKKSGGHTIKAKVILLVMSPQHLASFETNSIYSFKELIPAAQRPTTQMFVFLLSVTEKDLRSIASRVNVVHTTKIFNHDNETFEQSIAAACKAGKERRISVTTGPSMRSVQLVPIVAECEGGSQLVLSFSDPPPHNNAEVQILLTDLERQTDVHVHTSRLNPYTYTFMAPEHSPGVMSVSLMIDDKKVHSASPITLTYKSKYIDTQGLMSMYVKHVSRLSDLCLSAGMLNLDREMITLWNSMDILDLPTQTFDRLHGVHKYAPEKDTSSELPTLLHYAARYGLSEFSSRLIDLPDALAACRLQNKFGHVPEKIASKYGYTALAQFLEGFRQTGEEMDAAAEYICHNPGPLYQNNASARNERKKNPISSKATGKQNECPDYYNMSGGGLPNLPRQSSSTTSPTSPTTSKDNKSISGYQTMKASHQGLVDIMEEFKKGKLTMSDAEILFKQWRLQYSNNTSKSFKEHQEKINELRKELEASGMRSIVGMRNKDSTDNEPKGDRLSSSSVGSN